MNKSSFQARVEKERTSPREELVAGLRPPPSELLDQETRREDPNEDDGAAEEGELVRLRAGFHPLRTPSAREVSHPPSHQKFKTDTRKRATFLSEASSYGRIPAAGGSVVAIEFD